MQFISSARTDSRGIGLCISRRQAQALPAILVSCLLSGCGDGLASVTGAVTFDGQPLAGGSDIHATICFSPVGGGPLGVAALDSSGHYALLTGATAGIRPGKYLVALSATKIIPSASPGMPAGGRLMTPGKYANPKQSGLETDIHSGSNCLDFQLVSGAAR